jgi:transcriptional regulator with XRE-family HTH domain
MNFVGLQEALRKELRKRIAAGELTGMELARRTGFTQAHISNFLNRKRGLKLPALDRTLKTLGLSLYDLINPHELARYAAVPAKPGPEDSEVPIVAPEVAAAHPVIIREETLALARYRSALLNRIRPDLAAAARRTWTRFVVLEATAQEGVLLSPRLGPGAQMLVDRHYTTLRPYRKNERNLYAVIREDTCIVCYVETAENSLVLRPHNPESPVEIAVIPEGRSVTDFLVGRVAHVSTET